MSELKEKGIKLELKNENYTLYVDGKFIIESKDLDYVLEYNRAYGGKNTIDVNVRERFN